MMHLTTPSHHRDSAAKKRSTPRSRKWYNRAAARGADFTHERNKIVSDFNGAEVTHVLYARLEADDIPSVLCNQQLGATR
jgi:hypothetical protein